MIRKKHIHMGYFSKAPIRLTAAIALSALLFQSCDRTRIQKGYEYFPDMAHSLAYETYAPSKGAKNGITMQMPVLGSIPREMIPYQYPATPEGRLLAGKELVCKLEASDTNLVRGKEMFTIYCQNCHGTAGKGDGHLYTSGKFTMQPASLISERMLIAPIGEVYHVITMGWNTMGAHGPQIRPDDRWKIALYVKNTLQKNLK
ncbi:MAG: cytochrome c [Bacteroidota bacterium]